MRRSGGLTQVNVRQLLCGLPRFETGASRAPGEPGIENGGDSNRTQIDAYG